MKYPINIICISSSFSKNADYYTYFKLEVALNNEGFSTMQELIGPVAVNRQVFFLQNLIAFDIDGILSQLRYHIKASFRTQLLIQQTCVWFTSVEQ